MSDTISNDEAFNLISFGESKPSASSAPPVQGTALPPAAPAESKKAPKVVDVTQVPAPVLSVPKVDLPPADVAQQASQINKSMAEVTPVPVPPNPVEVAGKSLGMSDSALPYALGIGTGALVAYSAGKLKDRIEASKKQSAPRIEPTMAPEPTSERIVPPQQTQATPMQTAEQKLQSMQQARATRPGPVAPPVVPEAPLPPGATFADLAAMNAPQTTVQPITLDEATKRLAPAPAQPASAVAPVAPKEAGKPIKPKVEQTFKSSADLPEGKVFVPGVGGADSWLHSQAGPEVKQFIRDQFNEGKPYGSGKESMDKMFADVKKYDQWLRQNIPGGSLNRNERIAAGVPHPDAFPKLGKVVKVGGVLGLLVSANEAAQAAKKGDWGSVADIATDFIVPPFAGSSQLAPGTLDGRPASAKMMELSPIPGVGAGRGFVNPPMR